MAVAGEAPTRPFMKLHVVIDQDEAGYDVAEAPALPGCLSQGKTQEEALVNVKEAIEGWLEVMEAKSKLQGRQTVEIVV
ncbi:MAG TPA: type II toxin-antitoxin system HicB family antitoxin [Nitrospiraceae bacterium]|nr:type II toxin-antitoxin system HicB family antitoxin [Nitrospiraceae bacterium]